MRLLFDQNLSYRLVPALESLYPGSVHIRDVELAMADDETVWNYAKQDGLIIVSIVDSGGDPVGGIKVWAGLSPLIPQTQTIVEDTPGGERTAR